MATFRRLLSQAPRHSLSIRPHELWLSSSLHPTPHQENGAGKRVFGVEEPTAERRNNIRLLKKLTNSSSLSYAHGKPLGVAAIDEGATAVEARTVGVSGDNFIKGIQNGVSYLINQEKPMTLTRSGKPIHGSASRHWNGSCSSSVTQHLVRHYSTGRKSKAAYSGSEILNYMGGMETDEKQLVHKLVNFRMKQGKKTRVRAILHETLHRLARTDRDGVRLVADALENVKPICEVAKVRIAGNVYDVPGVVARDRQQTLAVRWVLDAATKRRTSHGSRIEECLFAEIMDAYRKRGTARKKREVLHGLASSNRSYAHFRWW